MVSCKKAGLHEIPVVLTEADDLKSLEFAIVEMFKDMTLTL